MGFTPTSVAFSTGVDMCSPLPRISSIFWGQRPPGLARAAAGGRHAYHRWNAHGCCLIPGIFSGAHTLSMAASHAAMLSCWSPATDSACTVIFPTGCWPMTSRNFRTIIVSGSLKALSGFAVRWSSRRTPSSPWIKDRAALICLIRGTRGFSAARTVRRARRSCAVTTWRQSARRSTLRVGRRT